MAESTVTRLIKVPRSEVYNALVDGQAFSKWLPPAGTTSKLYEFVPKIGGRLRMEITHGSGPEGTRLFELIFLEMRTNEAIVFGGAFVSEDPSMKSEMKITIELKEAAGGTNVTLRHEGIPSKISVKDNELGSTSSLDNLARLLERPHGA